MCQVLFSAWGTLAKWAEKMLQGTLCLQEADAITAARPLSRVSQTHCAPVSPPSFLPCMFLMSWPSLFGSLWAWSTWQWRGVCIPEGDFSTQIGALSGAVHPLTTVTFWLLKLSLLDCGLRLKGGICGAV